jgi:protein gp37
LLTKRIGNVRNMVEPIMWPHLPNVWLGATIVNQEEADRDIPKLLATPARVRFLSMEPLLGPVDLRRLDGGSVTGRNAHGVTIDSLRVGIFNRPRIDWIIVGGESGPKARPMHPDWARSLRDQCAAADVPFLFKQHGEWLATGLDRDTTNGYHKPRSYGGWVRIDGSGWHRGLELTDFTKRDAHVMHIGKKVAGRMLDGRTHDGFPEVRA